MRTRGVITGFLQNFVGETKVCVLVNGRKYPIDRFELDSSTAEGILVAILDTDHPLDAPVEEESKKLGFSIYTDGACLGNPGPGGCAAIITDKDDKLIEEVSCYSPGETTNNREELAAVILGIKSITKPSLINVFTDSQYVVGPYLFGHKRKTNTDLWQALDSAIGNHEIKWHWRPKDELPSLKRAHELSQEQAYIAKDKQEGQK